MSIPKLDSAFDSRQRPSRATGWNRNPPSSAKILRSMTPNWHELANYSAGLTNNCNCSLMRPNKLATRIALGCGRDIRNGVWLAYVDLLVTACSKNARVESAVQPHWFFSSPNRFSAQLVISTACWYHSRLFSSGRPGNKSCAVSSFARGGPSSLRRSTITRRAVV